MRLPGLILLLLLSVCFSLATQLGLRRAQSQHTPAAGGVLDAIMGDTRRLLANHFVTKADIYLHGGVYPSIFDQAARDRKSYLAAAAASPSAPHEADREASEDEHHDHGDHCEHDVVSGFLTKPRDWIDAFGRNFYPTKHVHLGEKGDPREILPWLQLAAELNPNEVQTYTLAAYWLRSRMGRIREAEEFLREGWRANPHSYEILSELGRLCEENRGDDIRARNLFEAALREWQKNQAGQEHPDEFAFMQLTGHLARLEQRQGHPARAIAYLEMLLKISPNREPLEKWLNELRAQAALSPSSTTKADRSN